jgi:hypothetical protein
LAEPNPGYLKPKWKHIPANVRRRKKNERKKNGEN